MAINLSIIPSINISSKVNNLIYNNWTYIQISEGLVFGARGDKSYYHFEHELKVDGDFKDVEETPRKLARTENYNELDERAYFSYPMGGWTESLSSYKFGSTIITAPN